MVYLNGVELLDHPPVIEVFVDLVFSYGMLDVIVLDLFRPTIVKVMDLASHLPAVLEVISLVHL